MEGGEGCDQHGARGSLALVPLSRLMNTAIPPLRPETLGESSQVGPLRDGPEVWAAGEKSGGEQRRTRSWFRASEIKAAYPQPPLSQARCPLKKSTCNSSSWALWCQTCETLPHAFPHWQGSLSASRWWPSACVICDFYLKANPRQWSICCKLSQQCDTWLFCHSGHSARGLVLPPQSWLIPGGFLHFSHSGAELLAQPFITGNNQQSCDLSQLPTMTWDLEGILNSRIPSAWPGPLFLSKGSWSSSEAGLSRCVGACGSRGGPTASLT